MTSFSGADKKVVGSSLPRTTAVRHLWNFLFNYSNFCLIKNELEIPIFLSEKLIIFPCKMRTGQFYLVSLVFLTFLSLVKFSSGDRTCSWVCLFKKTTPSIASPEICEKNGSILKQAPLPPHTMEYFRESGNLLNTYIQPKL